MGGDAQIISILHWMWYTLDKAQLGGVGGDALTTALQAHFSLFSLDNTNYMFLNNCTICFFFHLSLDSAKNTCSFEQLHLYDKLFLFSPFSL
jgi:hypothetical protein